MLRSARNDNSRVIQSFPNDILVSAASAWEIATKWRLGKLPEAGEAVARLPALIRAARFEPLPITLGHAVLAGTLTSGHRDPFDRLPAAQARLEAVPVMTIDPVFRTIGVEVVW